MIAKGISRSRGTIATSSRGGRGGAVKNAVDKHKVMYKTVKTVNLSEKWDMEEKQITSKLNIGR